MWIGFILADGSGRDDMAQIKIIASAITKEEQLDIARLLVKAGYTVNIKKGKVENNRSVTFINYKED